AAEFIRLEFIFSRTACKIIYNLCQAGDRVLVSILNNRNDKISAGQCNCHAYVDVTLPYDACSIDLNVDHWEILDRLNDSLYEYRREGQHIAGLALEIIFDLCSP